MAIKHLGQTLDMHLGGEDLIFPHHENEIAQSESLTGKQFARYWVHVRFLLIEADKMSKSLGNFVTIHELLSDWPGDVLRLNMLRTQYRQPLDWTVQGMKESWAVLERWYATAEGANAGRVGEGVMEALLDDLNTPQAIAELHQAEAGELAGGLALLGFTVDRARIAPKTPMPMEEIQRAIDARNAARKVRDFREADRIRDALAAKGIQLKDNPDGTTSWDVKR